MQTFDVALLGFGNVGRALAELLMRKHDTLRQDYGLIIRVTGISTARHGSAIDPTGINLRTALDAVRFSTLEGLHKGAPLVSAEAFAEACSADLVFESIPTNKDDGQPAIGLIETLLRRGIHVVTANKGPVVFAHRALAALAADHGVGFFFESSVMNGAPIFSLAREGLPAAEITRVRGIFNTTTNYILTRMEQDSLSFEGAVRAAQQIGIAETDPSLDVDGWDAAIKTAILANVLMGASLRPADVQPEGIRGITLAKIEAARKKGRRFKLLCEASRREDGQVVASVAPAVVSLDESFANVMGKSSVVEFYTDTLPCLTVIENDSGTTATAYGMLADMVNLARGRHIAMSGSPSLLSSSAEPGPDEIGSDFR